jgi:dephospho-CoA kinase
MTQLSNNNIVLVGVEKKVQQERLHNRGHSHEQIERRINSQFCTEKKKKVIADNINTS